MKTRLQLKKLLIQTSSFSPSKLSTPLARSNCGSPRFLQQIKKGTNQSHDISTIPQHSFMASLDAQINMQLTSNDDSSSDYYNTINNISQSFCNPDKQSIVQLNKLQLDIKKQNQNILEYVTKLDDIWGLVSDAEVWLINQRLNILKLKQSQQNVE
ncbi:hypothetical protein SS50377_21375 [Spironucleus salmonicida]|uniref:Uncharacterized protein n=1 Tax=Spironucleus salmonicida TaxID=348837 RepID=V6LI32_9EUKA|nr:hypothetical protein SS50377_21375 [Spironucleus salmonicida]|eukprot:EST44225.1 Hypothetical protein SS50377_15948 [Spironucleus salmonicida]